MHMTNIAFIFFIVIVAIVGNAPLAIFLGIIFSIYFKPDINFISRKGADKFRRPILTPSLGGEGHEHCS